MGLERERAVCSISGGQLTLIDKDLIAALIEIQPPREVAIEVKMIVDSGVDGDEFLRRGRAAELLQKFTACEWVQGAR